jgi:hypothetical protein
MRVVQILPGIFIMVCQSFYLRLSSQGKKQNCGLYATDSVRRTPLYVIVCEKH